MLLSRIKSVVPSAVEDPELKRKEQITATYGTIYLSMRKDRDAGNLITSSHHRIKDAVKIKQTLNNDLGLATRFAEEIIKDQINSEFSPAYKKFLSETLDQMRDDEAETRRILELVSKSEKCGEKELGETVDKKNKWIDASMTLLIATGTVATSMATASSGQSLCAPFYICLLD